MPTTKAPTKRAAKQPADGDELIALRRDLEIIVNAILEECLERDWCGEYNDWVAEINPRLSQPHLRPCESDEDEDESEE